MSNHWSKPGLFVCKYNSVFILNYNSMFMGYKVVKWCMSLNICSHHRFAVGIKQSSSVTRCCTCECTLYSEVFITINKCWYHTWHWFSFCILVLIFLCLFPTFVRWKLKGLLKNWKRNVQNVILVKFIHMFIFMYIAWTNAAYLAPRWAFTQTHTI